MSLCTSYRAQLCKSFLLLVLNFQIVRLTSWASSLTVYSTLKSSRWCYTASTKTMCVFVFLHESACHVPNDVPVLLASNDCYEGSSSWSSSTASAFQFDPVRHNHFGSFISNISLTTLLNHYPLTRAVSHIPPLP